VTQTLPLVVAALAGHRVLVIGDVMLDEYLNGDCSRLSPESPVPIVEVAGSRAVLGGAANTAANIRSLGGHASLVGCVGSDSAGHVIASLCRDAGIDLHAIDDGRATVRKVRVIGHQQQLLRLDYESAAPVDHDTERRVLDAALAELHRCEIVVISDYAKGTITARICQDVIHAAHQTGRRVVIDPRPQHAGFYVGCDYLTPNWKEAQGLAEMPEVAPTPEAIERVGRRITARFGAHALLTLGARGMEFFDRDGRTHLAQSADAREVFDVSGAGDTVAAAFSLALAAQRDHAEAMTLATRAAGIVVSKLGTATVTADELLDGTATERMPVGRDSLARLAASLRARGLRIATINGAFDLLHAGHLHILHEAKRHGDVLIVGLNSDASIRAQKQAGRPFVGEADRAKLLLALRDVDYVHIFDELTPIAFLELIKPDVHVNGSEYGENCIEAPTVLAGGGRIQIIQRLAGLSTSGVVDRILEAGRAGDTATKR
jgi:D-beta-D-heptose 7-phosphate kinase/D-beta-D-heptose 1-phosphate adenosyltransferase